MTETIHPENPGPRGSIRAEIGKQAGDLHSLVGTTADTASLLLEEVARAAVAIQSASTIADIKAAWQPLADLLGPTITRIDDGSCNMPHRAKGGGAAVLPEIEARATAIATVLEAASE